MFYCDECRKKNNWPDSVLFKSYGPCEMCGKPAICNDVPSSKLPLSKAKREKEEAS